MANDPGRSRVRICAPAIHALIGIRGLRRGLARRDPAGTELRCGISGAGSCPGRNRTAGPGTNGVRRASDAPLRNRFSRPLISYLTRLRTMLVKDPIDNGTGHHRTIHAPESDRSTQETQTGWVMRFHLSGGGKSFDADALSTGRRGAMAPAPRVHDCDPEPPDRHIGTVGPVLAQSRRSGRSCPLPRPQDNETIRPVLRSGHDERWSVALCPAVLEYGLERW